MSNVVDAKKNSRTKKVYVFIRSSIVKTETKNPTTTIYTFIGQKNDNIASCVYNLKKSNNNKPMSSRLE
jgi:F0F1-type ATP synthase alpha subunit